MLALGDLDILRYKVGFASQGLYYSIYTNGKLITCLKGKKELTAYRKNNAFTNDYLAFEKAPDEDSFYTSLELHNHCYIEKEIVPEPIENCLHSTKQWINSLMKGSKSDRFLGFLSEGITDRAKLYPDYKANRVDFVKPLRFNDISEYILKNYSTLVSTGIEADDAMADYQRTHKNTVICSTDKDMNTCPKWHYNPDKNVLYYVSQEDANLWYWCQMLLADTADNIGYEKVNGKWAKILKGWGPKKVYDLFVDAHPDYYPSLVFNVYKDFYVNRLGENAGFIEACNQFAKNRFLLQIGNRKELYNEPKG